MPLHYLFRTANFLNSSIIETKTRKVFITKINSNLYLQHIFTIIIIIIFIFLSSILAYLLVFHTFNNQEYIRFMYVKYKLWYILSYLYNKFWQKILLIIKVDPEWVKLRYVVQQYDNVPHIQILLQWFAYLYIVPLKWFQPFAKVQVVNLKMECESRYHFEK